MCGRTRHRRSEHGTATQPAAHLRRPGCSLRLSRAPTVILRAPWQAGNTYRPQEGTANLDGHHAPGTGGALVNHPTRLAVLSAPSRNEKWYGRRQNVPSWRHYWSGAATAKPGKSIQCWWWPQSTSLHNMILFTTTADLADEELGPAYRQSSRMPSWAAVQNRSRDQRPHYIINNRALS